MGSASPHTWDEGTFPVVPARQGHTHAHRHTQLRHQTQGSEGREGRAGKDGIRGIIGLTVCLPPPDAPRPSSLQHLPPGLRQLQGQRASKGKSGRGKEDRSSLGDSHKGGEDADPQHCSQLAQSIQEAKGRGPAREAPEPSHAAVRAQEEEDRQGKWGKMAGEGRKGGRVRDQGGIQTNQEERERGDRSVRSVARSTRSKRESSQCWGNSVEGGGPTPNESLPIQPPPHCTPLLPSCGS